MTGHFTFEISKNEKGIYRIQVPQLEVDSIHEGDLASVYRTIIFYHDTSEDKKFILGRNSYSHFTSDEIENLESLLDMHNQLEEIKDSFKKRKEE